MTWSDPSEALAHGLLSIESVEQNRSEHLLGWRLVVVWGLLMCSFLRGLEPEPMAAWLLVAGLLFAAARWSASLVRDSAVALLLVDAPVIFTLREQLPVPAGLLLTLVLVAGLATLSRALTALLVVELIAIHATLPGGPSGVEAGVARGLCLVAMGAWLLWGNTQRESR